MAIDVSIKKNSLLSKEELAAKFKADKDNAVVWMPTFSRLKVKREKETISGLIEVPDKFGNIWVRGEIIALGPQCGWIDGKQVHTFKVGQRIIYNKSHEQKYIDATGEEHIFLYENSDSKSILAIDDYNNEAVK
jgi:co-chaperonin GroES (HSP10)